MFNRVVHNLVAHRHFWRDVGFDEVSELYAAAMLKSLAINLVGIFIPVYLFVLGYSLQSIFAFSVIFYIARLGFDVLSGYMVARVGPKHTMALSTLLHIATLSFVLTLQDLQWPLWLVALPWAAAMSTHFIAYHVDFSKIKHARHSGKEIGFMFIFERLGSVFGPLVGGVVATLFDVRYTVVIAILIHIISLVPIFLTPEPVKTRQHLTFKGMPWRRHKRDYLVFASYGVDTTASVAMWPLLIAVTVFTTATFAKIGILMAISTAIMLSYTHLIGELTDKHRGGALLRLGVLANGIVNMLRPLMLSVPGVVATSIANDVVTATYKLPLTKGFYSAADSQPGYRIAYIVSCEVASTAAKLLFWLCMWLVCFWFDPVMSMQWAYVPVGFIGLLMIFQRFNVLKKSV